MKILEQIWSNPVLLQKMKFQKITMDVANRPTVVKQIFNILALETNPDQKSLLKSVRLDKKIIDIFWTPHDW